MLLKDINTYICFDVIMWETNHPKFFQIPIEILKEHLYFLLFSLLWWYAILFPSKMWKASVQNSLHQLCSYMFQELVCSWQSDLSWTQCIDLYSNAIQKHICVCVCDAETEWISNQNLLCLSLWIYVFHFLQIFSSHACHNFFQSPAVTIYIMLRPAYHDLKYTKFLLQEYF